MTSRISEKSILKSIDYYAGEIEIIYENDLAEINFKTITDNISTIEKLFKIANKYNINIPEYYVNKFNNIKKNSDTVFIC